MNTYTLPPFLPLPLPPFLCCFLSSFASSSLPLPLPPFLCLQMRGITGVAQPVGLYSVMIQISSHMLPSIHVIATARDSEVILGRDVLNHLIITLNGLAGVTEIEI